MLVALYGDPIWWQIKEYRRLSNQVKNLTKKTKKQMERGIAKELKNNPQNSGSMSTSPQTIN